MNTTVLEKKALKKLNKFSDAQLNAFLNDERCALGLQSLYYHNKYIMGFAQMTESTHKPMCDFIQTWEKKKKLLIGPRDCFKSSCDVIGYSCQLIAQNPNVKILIVSETEGTAKSYLGAIQNHLAGNATYKSTYAHLYKNYVFNVWNTECLNIAPIEDQTVVTDKEHTVDVAGIGTSKVGKHYDYVFFVDPHSQNNVNTKDQIEKVIVYYKLLNSIAKADIGRIMIEMTRWSFYDLANHLETFEKNQFEFYIKSAYNDDGTLFFPERLSQEHLDRMLETYGTYLFSCLYLSKPRSDKDKIFKPEIATYYNALPPSLQKIVFLDPSISESKNPDAEALKDSDDFAMLLLGVNRQTNAQYCMAKERINRKMPAQAVASLIAFLEVHVPDIKEKWTIAIETVAFQKIYKFEIERELSKHGHPYEVIELKPGGRAKKTRIIGLQPFYECGKMLFRAGTEDKPSPDLDILLQFEKFPFDKDDFIDCWAYALDLIDVKRETPPNQKTEQTYFRQKIKSGRQTGLKRRFV